MTSQNDDALERTLGQLVADATHDISSIVRSEVALAKAEMSADAKKAGLGAGMFAVAGILAFLALILLLIAAAYGLVAAGACPLARVPHRGRRPAGHRLRIPASPRQAQRSDSVQGKPERAIKSTQETIAAVRPSS